MRRRNRVHIRIVDKPENMERLPNGMREPTCAKRTWCMGGWFVGGNRRGAFNIHCQEDIEVCMSLYAFFVYHL